MKHISAEEAMRYMGAGAGDEDLRKETQRIAEELEKRIRPKHTWRAVPIRQEAEGILLVGTALLLTGRMAKRMLSECHTAVLMACTLGAEYDAMARSTEARDMARAVMLDACAGAWVEQGCDEAEAEIAARFPGSFLTDRFSPGYGDLPLDAQRTLLAALDAERRLGITLTDSLLMIPAKSVTAILGVSDRPQPARIRGCAYCALRERCTYRKRGKNCGE